MAAAHARLSRAIFSGHVTLTIISSEAIIAKELLTLSADARAILESMGDAFYALDAEWRFVYANRRALAFWGTTADSVIGQVIWQRFPSMVGTLNERVLRRVRAEQRVVTFEAESPTTGVWVSVNVGPSGDGVAVYWRDITERIEAEQALRDFADRLEREVAERTRELRQAVEELRQSRARYSAIFEHSPVDLVITSVQPDGRIVCEEANPAWVRHSGYPLESVVGRSSGGGPAATTGGFRQDAVSPRNRDEGAGRIRVYGVNSRSVRSRAVRFLCRCLERAGGSTMCC